MKVSITVAQGKTLTRHNMKKIGKQIEEGYTVGINEPKIGINWRIFQK